MQLRLPTPPTPGVPKIDAPLVEGVVPLPGRELGFAEYGDPAGDLVLWFHGTPGARRQIPPVARTTAAELGLHLVCVERPGVGDSTPYHYGCFADWAADAAMVADHLGHERFAVVGLSGGGPYALAAAACNPKRVPAVAILGGICPLVGPDAVPEPGGPVALSLRFQRLLEPIRTPFGIGLWLLLQPLMPLSHLAYRGFARLMPPGDRAVFADPGIEAMFISDLVNASRRRFGALPHDVALFGRDWGFALADVTAPVHWWHGDADSFVPLAQASHTTARIPDATLHIRPGESHLGGFAAADEVLHTIAGYLSRSGGPGLSSRAPGSRA